jgi:hypothetical protein
MAIIPEQPDWDGFPRDRSEFHRTQFEDTREALLSQLANIAAAQDFVRSLKPDALYRVVLPEGRLLQKGDDGLYRGVFYQDRGIEQHAKFEAAGPKLLDAATAAGAQVLLISIANQLSRIEEYLEELSGQLSLNNVAETEAGIQQLDRAMQFRKGSLRTSAILNAIQTLSNGTQKIIVDMTSRIEKAPEPTDRLLDHLVPFKDKTKEAAKALAIAGHLFRSLLRGANALVECYLVIGEPCAGARTLADLFTAIHDAVKMAADKARLVEFSGPVAPQHAWETFLIEYPRVIQKLDELIRLDVKEVLNVVEIDFRPHELEGQTNGQMPEM